MRVCELDNDVLLKQVIETLLSSEALWDEQGGSQDVADLRIFAQRTPEFVTARIEIVTDDPITQLIIPELQEAFPVGKVETWDIANASNNLFDTIRLIRDRRKVIWGNFCKRHLLTSVSVGHQVQNSLKFGQVQVRVEKNGIFEVKDTLYALTSSGNMFWEVFWKMGAVTATAGLRVPTGYMIFPLSLPNPESLAIATNILIAKTGGQNVEYVIATNSGTARVLESLCNHSQIPVSFCGVEKELLAITVAWLHDKRATSIYCNGQIDWDVAIPIVHETLWSMKPAVVGLGSHGEI